MDNNLTNSLRTEDEYSFISRTQGTSLQVPFPYEQDSNRVPVCGSDEFRSSSVTNGSLGDNEHLVTSYHALDTAYKHMKRRLSEVEQINKSLTRRLKATSLASNSVASFHSTMSSRDLDVAKAWEAYSDKCKECEKLRDDLREAEQKVLKSEIDARDSTFREDMLRAKSLEEEYKKQIQQAELDIRDHKNKLEMALENLEKEKEYTEMLRKSAEQRHHQMEATIASLRQSVQEENRKTQELNMEVEKQKVIAQELLEKREAQFKEKVHELEGRILHEREERTLFDKKIAELEKWKQDVEQLHLSSGIPISMSALQVQRMDAKDSDRDNSSGCSDIDADELVIELQSLTEELSALKKQTSYQSLMLSKICNDPRIQESFMSLSCNGFDDVESMDVSRPVFEPTQMERSSDGSSAVLSIDPRQLIEKCPSTLTPSDSLSVPHLAISRQIHSVESSGFQTTGRDSPQKIEIPTMPVKLSHAFNSIRINRAAGNNLHPTPAPESEEPHTEFYSAVENNPDPPNPPPLVRSNRGSQSSDSGTASNTDTLIEGSALNTNPEPTRPPPPLMIPKEKPHRPPHLTYGNHPAAGYQMQAIWPSAGQNVAGSNLTPLWPPGSMGSSNQSSFDVINDTSSDPPNTSSKAKRGQDLVEYLQKSGAREFKVQQINRPSRDSNPVPSNPFKHPSTVPSNRARTGDFNQVGANFASSTPSRRPDRHPSAVEQEEAGGGRAFIPTPESRACPVCQQTFSSGTSESYMQRHINAHFSGDETD